MKIEIRLFATFREGREKKQVLEIAEDMNIIDILKILNIDKEEVSILLLNGMDGGFDRKLKDGDILSIFPPVGGG
ncbi:MULTISPECIES: MoaD/ThiS family protein [Romboutsia]|uniref:Molybdopterin synthase/thiamin biosynthesis sulphur carrier, beta-grasp n=1 Tax=Romboutsia hominis TaxID=1507512 RepID=A0A2P2BSA7_9FIRM|nr:MULTISPECIES: MoaD/ThiS family protein [Romboutsia]MCH1960540.1 MoaD/ThiS family protein [Romboutsia hominis]MCH1969027.1 MoaD/ThiS family protein [Romboutsia hominis]MDB8805646.1 MoaD/ThiS family protein [Romboutsia sp. 1001216sp1]MDB8809039.1 MoaD/ThiS family protein [Romboutsia sp. 1001216sp1]MDB8811121.1 MoaD/ThiS family protein [Romboutsia sp. 1001216sp1]